MNNKQSSYTICATCKGRGIKKQRIRKKARLYYERGLEIYEATDKIGPAPVKPVGHLSTCETCKGSGLAFTDKPLEADHENYPHVAIIGGGIGGVALAVACLHRQIPFTLFERDSSFDARAQGYGLTLQQASKPIAGLGLFTLEEGIISTRHVVHEPNGTIVGEWGLRKWLADNNKTAARKSNIHIARQSLRLALLEQLGGDSMVQWNHQLLDFKETESNQIVLTFQVGEQTKTTLADLVVGADGIRSTVRNIHLGNDNTPLRYLDCIVILGICKLDQLHHIESELLDGKTVFQTANGTERIYMMPYDADSIMWQFSFPMDEADAKALSAQGPAALKQETILRTPWHTPIPQIVAATAVTHISGYPVYDRDVLDGTLLAQQERVTLLGDAAHPMSPFKGQGANQALLDALSLAREIKRTCRPGSNWRETGIRKSTLKHFEKEMLARTAIKVKDSAAAAQFLHSDAVLHKSNAPRGNLFKSNKA